MGGKKRIPTGIAGLDQILAGGMPKGHLGAIIAPPGPGVPSLPTGLRHGSYTVLCAVCGKDLDDVDREFAMVCSRVCDAEQRLSEDGDPNVINFKVKLAQPVHFIQLKVDIDVSGSGIDSKKVEQAVKDFVDYESDQRE